MHAATRTTLVLASFLSITLHANAAVAAAAATAKDGTPAGFGKSGSYVFVSPGAASNQWLLGDGSWGLGETEPGKNPSKLFYQWGLGVGVYKARRIFAFTAGFTFSHATAKHDPPEDLMVTSRGHIFRFGPEIRLGAHGKKWFGYGLLDIHGLVDHSVANDSDPDVVLVSESATHGGFGGTVGAGALGMLGRFFILGGELKVPLDYVYSPLLSEAGGPVGFAAVAFDVRIVLGVKF